MKPSKPSKPTKKPSTTTQYTTSSTTTTTTTSAPYIPENEVPVGDIEHEDCVIGDYIQHNDCDKVKIKNS